MKKIYLLIYAFLAMLSVKAQDIIIKNDKSEIKSKVLEISEELVKYKQFDFHDGPTYNIRKSEIFMIIYKNGKRESFSDTPVNLPSTPQKNENQNKTEVVDSPAEKKRAGTSSDIKNSESNIKPQINIGRITTDVNGLGLGVISLRLDYDYNIFRRFIYLGFTSIVSTYTGGGDTYSAFGLSSTFYLPLSSLLTEQQNSPLKGINPFFRPGVITNFSNFGFTYDVGVDLLFLKRPKVNGSWGISAFTTKLQTFNLGLAVTIK